jgi:Do/DeqQ family serine protease
MRQLLLFLVFMPVILWASPTTFSPAVKKALPSVVAITAEQEVLHEDMHPLMKDPFFRKFFDDHFPERRPHRGEEEPLKAALGSGVIVSEKGYILTNYHVIKHAKNITIQLNDEREFEAEIIGSDPDSDLAVLKIEEKNLPVATIGNDQDLEIGDIVLAIGNPFGVGQTVTQGIVSAMKRKNLGLNLFESYIQTDAAINPGNSGGALVNYDGQVIGINTAIISSSGGNNGIGFAVPMSFAQQVMQELIEDGHVTRGWLGIYMAELTDKVKKSLNYNGHHGVLVTGIARFSPASQSGIRPGDIILSIDGNKIRNASDISQIVLASKPNSKLEVEVSRGDQEIIFSVIIGIREQKK